MRGQLDEPPSGLLQSRLRWFGHAARRGEGEVIRDLLVEKPLADWRKRSGGQVQPWTATLKEDLTIPSGPTVLGLGRQNRG